MNAMIHGRLPQLLQLFVGLVLLFSAIFSANIFLGVLAALYVAFCIFALISPQHEEKIQRQLAELHAQGLYPLLSQASDDDVRRLLHAGHRLFAIRLYRELHQVSLQRAIAAVKQME